MTDIDEKGRRYENTFVCVRKEKKRDNWWTIELRALGQPLGPWGMASSVDDGLTDEEAAKYEVGQQYDVRLPG